MSLTSTVQLFKQSMKGNWFLSKIVAYERSINKHFESDNDISFWLRINRLGIFTRFVSYIVIHILLGVDGLHLHDTSTRKLFKSKCFLTSIQNSGWNIFFLLFQTNYFLIYFLVFRQKRKKLKECVFSNVLLTCMM